MALWFWDYCPNINPIAVECPHCGVIVMPAFDLCQSPTSTCKVLKWALSNS